MIKPAPALKISFSLAVFVILFLPYKFIQAIAISVILIIGISYIWAMALLKGINIERHETEIKTVSFASR